MVNKLASSVVPEVLSGTFCCMLYSLRGVCLEEKVDGDFDSLKSCGAAAPVRHRDTIDTVFTSGLEPCPLPCLVSFACTLCRRLGGSKGSLFSAAVDRR
jgi:hypothetical protein